MGGSERNLGRGLTGQPLLEDNGLSGAPGRVEGLGNEALWAYLEEQKALRSLRMVVSTGVREISADAPTEEMPKK